MHSAFATDYFINNASGNDANVGTSAKQPFKSIEKINTVLLKPGDRILFAAGQVFHGELRLIGVQGLPGKLVVVGSYFAGSEKPTTEAKMEFMINAKGMPNGLLIQDCSYVVVKHAIIEADGYETEKPSEDKMRVGVKITASPGNICKNIQLDSLEIKNIYFENKGFVRNAGEVKTANGTQRYGWGIRLLADQPTAQITQVEISNCRIRDVASLSVTEMLLGSTPSLMLVAEAMSNSSLAGLNRPESIMCVPVLLFPWNRTGRHARCNPACSGTIGY